MNLGEAAMWAATHPHKHASPVLLSCRLKTSESVDAQRARRHDASSVARRERWVWHEFQQMVVGHLHAAAVTCYCALGLKRAMR